MGGTANGWLGKSKWHGIQMEDERFGSERLAGVRGSSVQIDFRECEIDTAVL